MSNPEFDEMKPYWRGVFDGEWCIILANKNIDKYVYGVDPSKEYKKYFRFIMKCSEIDSSILADALNHKFKEKMLKIAKQKIKNGEAITKIMKKVLLDQT